MRRNLVLAVFVAGLLSAVAFAQTKEPAGQKTLKSIRTWFIHWKQALEKSAVEGRYRKGSTAAVAAIRGGPQGQEDTAKPYWKGSIAARKEAQLKKERGELASAVALILEGKFDEGGKALDAFETSHPKSSLLKDVSEARGRLKELKAASEAEKPAAPVAVQAAPAQTPQGKQ